MQQIKDILTSRQVLCVGPEDSVRQAVAYICKAKTGAVLVKIENDVLGIFTERDVLHRVVNKGLAPDKTTIREVMSTKLIHVHMDDTVPMAKALMAINAVRHLLVEGDNNELEGILSMRDLMQVEAADASGLIRELNDKYYQEAYKAKWWIAANRVIVQPYVPQ